MLEAYRGNDIGTMLVNECIADIKKRGGTTMWLTGRAPEFYAKLSFEEVDVEDSPLVYYCPNCSQFKVNCFPAIMKIDF